MIWVDNPILTKEIQTGNGVRVTDFWEVLQECINSHCLDKAKRGILGYLLKQVSWFITHWHVGMDMSYNSPPIIKCLVVLYFGQWQWNGGSWSYGCCWDHLQRRSIILFCSLLFCLTQIFLITVIHEELLFLLCQLTIFRMFNQP